MNVRIVALSGATIIENAPLNYEDSIRDVCGQVQAGLGGNLCRLAVGTVGLGSGSLPLASPRFGTESDLELELVESAARFNCPQPWANYAVRQLELKIQISSVRIHRPRES